ncbi:MAG: AsmA family protein [Acidobacteriia bacterium]|nr:AsmA family protein [Terriglobia bacterium]
MKIRPRTVLRSTGAAVVVLLVAGIVAPYLNADPYGQRLKRSLEQALGRQVDIGKVRFSLLPSPAFSVEPNESGPGIVIHEDPSIGIEPMAYVETLEVRPSLWSLLRGKFVIASIRLEDDVSINLAKTGQGSEWGRWNFASFVNPSLMSNAPAIHVRNGRIHFKFGDTKSVFYLTETDLDISPPRSRGGGWRVYCSGRPARTDRSSQGLGSFTLSGRWYVAPERVDMDLRLDRTGLGEITALIRGQSGNIHGTVSSRLHFGGAIDKIGIQGRLTIEDVHRWDLLPPQGQGWPIDIRGRLDLLTQQLDLQSTSAQNATPPLWVRFRVTDYLSQPHWAVAVNWNRFPVEPLMELATHMGAQFPPKLGLSGTMDGAIGYSGEGSFQGQLGFHETALTIPDSPPVRFDQAYVILDHGHVRLSPAVVHTADQDQAEIQADYAMNEQTLDLSISTEAMKVASLRSQVALAAVPWLEQVKSGVWSGQLNYHQGPAAAASSEFTAAGLPGSTAAGLLGSAAAGWTGRLGLRDAEIPVPGLADPVQLTSAHAQIDGARVVLDQIDAAAGKVAFTGEYRYEPGAARPHRLRLRIEELDAADLEAELLPTLRRSAGLLERALGRATLPDWLADRQLDGSVQIDELLLGGSHLQNLRARLVWDVAHVELDAIQAKLDRAAITGRLAINLHGNRPSYKLTGEVKGLSWQSGKVDAEGTLETSGTGSQVLANLTSEATFTALALDFGALSPWRSVSGTANLAWSPRLHLTGLNLKMEDETYTGRGATLDDGRLVILLSNGAKEMRMTGTLAKLKLEEAKP